jgi:hypothetical protein
MLHIVHFKPKKINLELWTILWLQESNPSHTTLSVARVTNHTTS